MIYASRATSNSSFVTFSRGMTTSQYAFLKSFEEPPKYAVIIMVTTSQNKLLPTILSRGTRIVFSPFPQKDIERFIFEKYSLNEAKAGFVAAYSGGIIGRAIDIVESEDFFKKRDRLIKAISTLSGDKISILTVQEAFNASGRKAAEEIDMYFDVFMGFFRDVQVFKEGGKIINSDYRELIEEFSARVRGRAARNVINIAADVRSKINNSMKYDLWITNMLINCWEEIHGTGNRS